MEQTLQLHDDDLIGKGAHKATYYYPNDSEKCIKIPYDTPDVDVRKELFYRKVLAIRGRKLDILTEYFGTVHTNKGEGYCFEVLRDANGTVSQSLKAFLSGVDSDNPSEILELRNILIQFKKSYLNSKVITSDMDPENFFIQRLATGTKVRIIDNIGTSATIPIMYFLDFMAVYHNKKYWKRFCRELKTNFPKVFNLALYEELIS